MGDYQESLREETAYLEGTLALIKQELSRDSEVLADRKKRLIAARRDMWENTGHHSGDFTKLTEMNQYMSEIHGQTANYIKNSKQVERFRQIVDSPYFGRFDFAEDGLGQQEKVYVGLCNVTDPQTGAIRVYDWRAPISGIFYRSDLGRASYAAPCGLLSGEVLLKRQYKISDSKLGYFLDCSVTINDEILQEVLSKNSSAKMKNIVETIQKEQDEIIRDTDNELLVVQGAAGSGKTSAALHRIAFLLYHGLGSNLRSGNILIISPNNVFRNYISHVLPELGEENVQQATFEELAAKVFGNRFWGETRNNQLEALINLRTAGGPLADEALADETLADEPLDVGPSAGEPSAGEPFTSQRGGLRRQSIEFKGSLVFRQILDRLLRYYAHREIKFTDVYFHGQLVESSQQLKMRFLNDKTGLPMAKRLKRMENMLWEKVRPLQKELLERLKSIVARSEGHEFEIPQFSRLLSIKLAKVFLSQMHGFTKVDFQDLYNLLFQREGLLIKLAEGLELPDQVDQIISATRRSLERNEELFEDCAPLMYLKLKIEGNPLFEGIGQAVIDEAQDYTPLQYEVFHLLLGGSRFTVLGDAQQTLEKNTDVLQLELLAKIFRKQACRKLSLTKSYRSSWEINAFAGKLLGNHPEFVSFERFEAEPAIVSESCREELDRVLARDIAAYLDQGFESIAVICKTWEAAKNLAYRLSSLTEIKLVNADDEEFARGALVIPAYMVKGLEFDVVLVDEVSERNYAGEWDKKLLYTACTRALHRLGLYHTGKISRLINWARQE